MFFILLLLLYFPVVSVLSSSPRARRNNFALSAVGNASLWKFDVWFVIIF